MSYRIKTIIIVSERYILHGWNVNFNRVYKNRYDEELSPYEYVCSLTALYDNKFLF